MNSIITITKKCIRAAIGLIMFGFGLYMTIQANIGAAPWDVFSLGITNYIPLTFGQVNTGVGVIIVIIDVILKERIGLGTLLDTFLVGLSFDVFNSLNIVPTCNSIVTGLVVMTVGMFLMAIGQFIYMKAAICCGPRDSLLVALGKRAKKIPIGAVCVILEVVVLVIGWIMGGPVGIGTAYSALGVGVTMQIVFNIVKFEPRDVKHQGLGASAA